MEGSYCRVEPLIAEDHAKDLYSAFQHDTEGRVWTYLPYGPFERFDTYRAHVLEQSTSDDPLFFPPCPQKHARPLQNWYEGLEDEDTNVNVC